jgi:hypothetical protein
LVEKRFHPRPSPRAVRYGMLVETGLFPAHHRAVGTVC